jgi:osmotically-inducible protein OsmY
MEEQMTDKLLRKDILEEFEFDPSFDAEHIGVAVENNVVTLSGHVDNYAQKLAAIAATRRVKGVHAIAEEIQVRFPFQPKTADDQIAKRAIDILRWNSTIAKFSIDVLVQQGWITLSGFVDWQFERNVAEDCVRKLSGVVGVSNDIKLKAGVNTGDVKAKIEAALKRHAEIEADAIRVVLKGSDHVILEGKVHSWAERRAAENAAWSAPGVLNAEDHITLR